MNGSYLIAHHKNRSYCINTHSGANRNPGLHDTYASPNIKLPYSLIQMQRIRCTILPNYIPWVCFDFFLVYFSLLPRISLRAVLTAPADQNVMLWPSASLSPLHLHVGGRWRRVSLAASRCLGNEVLAIFVGEGGEFNYKDICVPGKSVILGLEVGIFLARPPLSSLLQFVLGPEITREETSCLKGLSRKYQPFLHPTVIRWKNEFWVRGYPKWRPADDSNSENDH